MSQKPLLVLYEIYKKIMNLIPICSMLRRTEYDLIGIKLCVEKGANPDKSPDHSIHMNRAYYSWFAWRKYTILLTEKCVKNNFSFTDTALLEFIGVSQNYLKLLKYIWIFFLLSGG